MELDLLRQTLQYGAWANGELLRAAADLPDRSLDERFDMGVGSLRRTLLHIYNGEFVWLHRWMGKRDTPWPSEDEPVSMATLHERLANNNAAREIFLQSLEPSDVNRRVIYRDSRGSLFSTTLRDMLLQGVLHSHHHRAQAVNMLRRVGGRLIDLDYMYHTRVEAQEE